MKEQVENAIRDIDADDWEQLCSDILRADGHDVKPTATGSGGDGGKDALISRGGRDGIAHYTTRKKSRTKSKLKKDADKAAAHDRDYDVFVFMTNQKIGGAVVDDLVDDHREEYGWELKIWHRETVRNFLMGSEPELAASHLGVDPRASYLDGKQQIDDYHEDCIQNIATRDQLDIPLADGPVLTLHLLPNGHDTVRYVDTPSELPLPPIYGKDKGVDQVQIGDAVYSVSDRLSYMGDTSQEQPGYTRLDEHGRFEAAGTSPFMQDSRTGEVVLSGEHMEVDLARTLKGALRCLKTLEVSPPVYLYVTVQDVKDVQLQSSKGNSPMGGGGFGTDSYAPPAVEVSSFDNSAPELLREPVNRIWTKARWNNGSPFYNDDGWTPPRGV
ncbi:restriction endonuclease [Halorarum halobium]|uniref:restriction endonuclease n=1 Tax=Halorarum halobium TaxID=3075121 RepID=UPI0028ADD56D|nr:restriction endonuclease [Halobaculum sp. XH14]